MISQRETERKYNALLKDVATKDFYKVDLENRVNCYKCDCGHITKTKDVDAGVTPFMIICEKCNGIARSTFYNDIAPEQEPTQEWYRPTLKQCLKLRNDFDMLEHILNGGLDVRKITVVFLISLLLISCGSTKKLKQSQSVQIKSIAQSEIVDKSQTSTNENTNVKIESQLNIDNVNQTITETFTAKPIDNTKPAIFVDNGKTINLTNTELTKTKTSDFKRNIDKSAVVVESEKKVAQTVKNNVKTNEKAKVAIAVKSSNKDLDRKQFDFTWVIIIATACFIFCMWWFFGISKRKSKDNSIISDQSIKYLEQYNERLNEAVDKIEKLK